MGMEMTLRPRYRIQTPFSFSFYASVWYIFWEWVLQISDYFLAPSFLMFTTNFKTTRRVLIGAFHLVSHINIFGGKKNFLYVPCPKFNRKRCHSLHDLIGLIISKKKVCCREMVWFAENTLKTRLNRISTFRKNANSIRRNS